jgi:hypothetical protein
MYSGDGSGIIKVWSCNLSSGLTLQCIATIDTHMVYFFNTA